LTYKWPFDAKKQTYLFFDPISQQAPPAHFVGTEKLFGLNLYKYEAVISDVNLDVGPGIPGTYDDTRTVWVEPRTGTIVKGVEHQTRKLATGQTALDTTLTFDQPSQKSQADYAKNGIRKIDALTIWFPIIALIVGIAALVGGLALARRNPGGSVGPGSHAAPEPDTAPVTPVT
jgi:hypothetical protein